MSRSVSSSTHGWRGRPERYLWGGSRGLRAGRGFGDHLHHCSHWYHLLSSYYAPDTDRVLSSTAEVGISILILQMVTLKLRERERERFPQDPGVSGQVGRRSPVLDSLPSALSSTLCGFLEP